MILISTHDCGNALEARKQERKYIEEIEPSLNQQLPTITLQEWKDENKDIILSRKKQYYNTNKDDILSKMKDFYTDNKDRLLQKNKDYFLQHKDAIMMSAKKRNETNK